MSRQVVSIKIIGPAGMGIKSSGRMLAEILVKNGFFISSYSEYPSLVRGGQNTYQISFSSKKVFAPHQKVDFLFSLEKKPFYQLAQDAGDPQTANTVCLGIISFIFDLKSKIVFPKKNKENQKAFTLGYQYAQKNYQKYWPSVPKNKKHHLKVYDGNEAFGWGFIRAKGNFYAGYPMTPSTGAIHFLAAKQKEFGFVVRHPEDEIAAANMAAGAAFAGGRAAVGTSGGGFALMNETISFCGMAEIGMVFYLVQRPAPATGMPTWTAQGDLLYSIFSGHGEFPKIVLAPGDQQESFTFSWQAFNLAENLQTPVILMSDKYLAEGETSLSDLSQKSIAINHGRLLTNTVPKNFQRYDWRYRCGRSFRTIPGVPNGEFLANSYEHNQKGFSTEDPQIASKMAEKRMRKLKTALRFTPKPKFFGNPKAKKLIVSWGSTKGPILEAIDNDNRYAFLQIRTLWPLHSKIEEIIKRFKEIIVIENNQTSQLTTLLKTQFNFQPTKKILKFDGRPFFPEEINEQLK